MSRATKAESIVCRALWWLRLPIPWDASILLGVQQENFRPQARPPSCASALRVAPTYGGSGVVATELGIELAALGHQVHFISYSQPFRLNGRNDGIFYHEVPVSNYPLFEFPPYDLALASRMAEVAEFYELDLLHVHYAIPHSVSALLARQMLVARGRRLPFVTTLHGTDITLVGTGPQLPAHYALRYPGKRWRYQHFKLPEGKNHSGFQRDAAY